MTLLTESLSFMKKTSFQDFTPFPLVTLDICNEAPGFWCENL